MVSVKVRDTFEAGTALLVADKLYVINKPEVETPVGIDVTRFLFVVVIDTNPAEVAPGGAANCTESVTPVGNAVLTLPRTFTPAAVVVTP